MSGITKIEWAERVWNPITGCTKCSPACDHCYAERMSKRLAGRCGYPAEDPFRVTLHEDKLMTPLGWRKPARIFVGSMTDLFHEDVPDEQLDRIFAVMALCSQHTFMLLTKRPERMLAYLTHEYRRERIFKAALGSDAFNLDWLLPNVWLGATIWDQASADRSVPILLSTPAAKRFASVEPMLGPVDLRISNQGGTYDALTGRVQDIPGLRGCGLYPALDWVICGGETGPGARPMHPDWPRSLRDQCQAAEVPFFFKQWGEYQYEGVGEAHFMVRVGKRKAGRVLDGRTWEEVPA